MTIQRYEIVEYNCAIYRNDAGEFVRYEDYAAEVEALKTQSAGQLAAIKRMRGRMNIFQELFS